MAGASNRPLTLMTPPGIEILSPSIEQLRAIIFDTDQQYWDSGSGDAAFGYMDGRVVVTTEPWLIFFMQEPSGFHFQFMAETGGSPLVPFDGTDTTRTVTHYVGGDRVQVPEACFVTRATGLQIARHFIEEREPWPGVTWVKLYGLDYDTGCE